jgi:phage replication O-like protein O
MADVQLEHGHVRIANRLAEAMLDAEFSGSQFKMLHGLIRLTYGWRRRTVTLSHAELAAYLHTTPSGTFRAALRELVTEGVVLQLEQGVGHKKSTLAIQKDFTRWGKFSVAPERLERMFGGRPESADELIDASSPPTPASETGEEPGAPPVVPDPTPAESVPAGPPAQRQAYGLPENRQAARPEVGTVAGTKWLPPQGMPQRKDSDRQGNTDDSDFGAPRERELIERLPQAADEVALFLSQFDGVRRIAWVGRLHDLLDRTPHFTPDEVREGLAAFMARLDKSEQGPVALRAFCQRVRDDAARPPEDPARTAGDRPRGAPRGGNAGEAEAGRAFAAIRKLITVRPVTGQAPVRYIAKTEVEKLGKAALDAYEQIGGAERFLDQNEQIGFLLRDFTAAYRNALQEGAA